MDGVTEYHASVLSNVEINNCKVASSSKVQLNKNNISEVQSAFLKAFKESNDDENYYAISNKHYGKYYSIMHDSIQKFSQELNGSMIRTVSSDNNVVNVPWSLTNIEGETLNVEKLVKHLIDLIASIKPVINNAFSAVFTEVKKRTQKYQHLHHQNTSNVVNFKKLILILFNFKWPTGQLVLWQMDAQQIFLPATN